MTTTAQQAEAPQSAAPAREHQPVPGSLALDLINTEFIDRGKRRDLLMSPDALTRWWEEARRDYPDECAIAGGRAPAAWTSELLEAVIALRAALRATITHVAERHAVEEEDLKPITETLALGYSALERTGQGSVKAVMRLHDPERGNILVPVAFSALRLFTQSDWHRLRQCKSDRCIFFFYDTTKSGTRRWCTPVCMNRARSIRHYQMIKQKASAMPAPPAADEAARPA